jgi:SPP1 family predicted phage head-tail adaptor
VLSRAAVTDPGRLRLRLTLEKPAATPDGAGGFSIAFASAAVVAADVVPLQGEERRVGEGVGDVVAHRVVIRHRADVETGDRFRLGERLLSIKSIFDPHEDGRFLVCLCEEEGR